MSMWVKFHVTNFRHFAKNVLKREYSVKDSIFLGEKLSITAYIVLLSYF